MRPCKPHQINRLATHHAYIGMEDHLRLLAEIEVLDPPVTIGKFMMSFGVYKDAARQILHRLVTQGYLTIGVGNSTIFHLTDMAKRQALLIQKRHNLAEWMFFLDFNLPWYDLHVEADRWEHDISEDFTDILARKYGSHLYCPHGNPLTGYSPAKFRTYRWVPLREVAEIDDAADEINPTMDRYWEVAAVYENDHDLLKYFWDLQLVPGKTLTVVPNRNENAVGFCSSIGTVQISQDASGFVWMKKPGSSSPRYRLPIAIPTRLR